MQSLSFGTLKLGYRAAHKVSAKGSRPRKSYSSCVFLFCYFYKVLYTSSFFTKSLSSEQRRVQHLVQLPSNHTVFNSAKVDVAVLINLEDEGK